MEVLVVLPPVLLVMLELVVVLVLPAAMAQLVHLHLDLSHRCCRYNREYLPAQEKLPFQVHITRPTPPLSRPNGNGLLP